MKKLQPYFTFIFLIVSSLTVAQKLEIDNVPLDACAITFESSISIADLDLFATCFVKNLPSLEMQSTLQTEKINFRKLPPIIDAGNQFSSIQNIYREPTFMLGDYDRFENTYRVSNLAFFEANRNSVLSAGYVVYPEAPNF